MTPGDTVTISAAVVPISEIIAFQTDIPQGASFRQAEDLDGFFVHIPSCNGRAHWTIGARQFVCNSVAGYVGPMHETDRVDFIGTWGHKALKVPYKQMARHLSLLLDQPFVGRLEFDPVVDLTTGPAWALISMLDLVLTPFDGDAVLAKSSLAAVHFSETLSLLLLENFRHSHTEAMASIRKPSNPTL